MLKRIGQIQHDAPTLLGSVSLGALLVFTQLCDLAAIVAEDLYRARHRGDLVTAGRIYICVQITVCDNTHRIGKTREPPHYLAKYQEPADQKAGNSTYSYHSSKQVLAFMNC